jgi:hypothetical protein
MYSSDYAHFPMHSMWFWAPHWAWCSLVITVPSNALQIVSSFFLNPTNPMVQGIFWKLAVVYMVRKFPFNESENSLSCWQKILSLVSPVQTPYILFIWDILILVYHLCVGLQSGLCRQDFLTDFLCTSHFLHACYMFAYLIPFNLITLMFGEEFLLWSSSLCNFHHPPVTSCLFCSNILFRSLLLWNILSL